MCCADPFSQVLGKKDKKKKVSKPISFVQYLVSHLVRPDARPCGHLLQREEERKKDGSKVIEVRRQPNTGQGGDRRNRDRGPRTSIDRNGHDRSAGRGASPDASFTAAGLVRPAMPFPRGRSVLQGSLSQPGKRRKLPSRCSSNESEPVAYRRTKSRRQCPSHRPRGALS